MAKAPKEFEAPAPKTTKGRNIPEEAIQLVSCEVAMGSQHQTVVQKGPFRAVTYPETMLLEALHQQPGKSEAVRRVRHAGYVKRSFRAEKRRLQELYGKAAVERVFPGNQPQMERFHPADAPTPGTKCLVGDWADAATDSTEPEIEEIDATG
jgi:hypothetical protein